MVVRVLWRLAEVKWVGQRRRYLRGCRDGDGVIEWLRVVVDGAGGASTERRRV